MTEFNNKLLVALGILFLAGCDGCMKSLPQKKDSSTRESTKVETSYSLSLSTLFSKTARFNYRSQISIVSKNGPASSGEENFESIEIIGAHPRVLLKKRTDSQHFIEIIKDAESYFVKNAGKEFRRGIDNKVMYEKLIDDGINLLSFMLDQFDLRERITRDANRPNHLMIKAGPVSASTFAENLKSRVPEFSTVESSNAIGAFVVDEQLQLPISGQFEVSFVGPEQRTFFLKASFALNTNPTAETIALPVIVEEEPTTFPVDVARKFNELMDRK